MLPPKYSKSDFATRMHSKSKKIAPNIEMQGNIQITVAHQLSQDP